MSRDTDKYEIGETFRSECGNARLTYHPDWSDTLPWVSYRYGTASWHYATLNQGVAAMAQRGFTILTTRPKPE